MNLFDSRRPALKFNWKQVTNVAVPEHYTDDFSSDKGYFTEENGTKDWKIENGVLTASAGNEGALTYLHIYEKNVTVKVRFRITELTDTTQLYFILRYNSPEAYVTVKYLAGDKIWGLYSSEGADFPVIKHTAANGHTLNEGEWHELEYTVDGDCATASLDGDMLINENGMTHLSPGRIAVGVKSARIEISDFDAAFLSGQGTLMRNIVHNKLPDEKYREGGTVFEMSDGSLTYIHGSGDTFTSLDNGTTWQRADQPWTFTYGYPNILNLGGGSFIKIGTRKAADGSRYKFAELSHDDGKTWTAAGDICNVIYEFAGSEATGGAINMNDKITRISSGRIFYVQNYSFQPPRLPLHGKYLVLCEAFYSDDLGMTWHKSKMSTFELEGNENEEYFGECKILECSDGTLRMYNSWNGYGCIVYSESTDGGETWGAITKLPELICARSSMQFSKDVYADNDTTYYMVWVYSEPIATGSTMCRSRLSLAKSTDGKRWDFLGDLWRWESSYLYASHLCHAVDPFIMTTKDHVVCGSGFTEYLEREEAGDHIYHHAQRQHIYSVKKASLTPTELKPV